MRIRCHALGCGVPARCRPIVRRLSMFLVAGAFATFAASALAGSFAREGSFVISGSITSADPVFSNPHYLSYRLQCGTEPNDLQASGTFHYKVYTFQNLR